MKLVDLASRIWRAEATGIGREKWPDYFGDEPLRAPYRDVRIQAGIARTVGSSPDRARVRLVWAGVDPAGDEEDGRLAQVVFIRHNSAWHPIR
ncbi:hypothetical protein [Streptomyces sp. NPDC001450]